METLRKMLTAVREWWQDPSPKLSRQERIVAAHVARAQLQRWGR